MTTEDLLNYYYRSDTIVFDGRRPLLVFNPNQLLGAKVSVDVRDPKSNDIIVKEGKKFTRPVLRQLEAAKVKHVPIAWEDIIGRVAAHDIVDSQTKEVLVECNQEITQEKLDLVREKGIHQIEVLFIDESSVGPYLRNTLLQDRIRAPQDAILEIYRRLRPGDPPTIESAPTSCIRKVARFSRCARLRGRPCSSSWSLAWARAPSASQRSARRRSRGSSWSVTASARRVSISST